jgi:3-dehydroquinate synthase
MAEVIKAGLLGDPDLFALLEREVDRIWGREGGPLEESIGRAISVKARIVEKDEREGGMRQLLNLGHTFGHALEAALGFRGIRHGEAVAVGLVAACRLSHLLGVAPPELEGRVAELLRRYRLPTRWPGVGWEEIRLRLAQDKKAREDGWTFVLTGGVGDASVHRHVPEAPVREAAAHVLD